MAYTSGRTVKSSKAAKPSNRVAATREARRLVTRYLPGVAGVTVDSYGSADLATLASQIRTVITFPETADASDLACAVERLPGVVRTSWTSVAITIVRAVN